MKNVEKNSCESFLQGIKYVFIILSFPVFCFSQDSIAEDKISRIQIHGFIKNMQSASFLDKSSSLVTGNFIHNRINFRWDISNSFHTRIEARNRFFYGEQVKGTYQFGKYIDTDKGLFDLSYNLVDDTSVVLNVMLDRALINWSNSRWDITAGRQRINWGINLVWNPNDIFNAFNYLDFDYEERPGSDALRIQYNTGRLSSLELAYKFSKEGKEQVGAVMYKTNFRKYDLQNFAGVHFEDVVLGTGWAGNIKNAGFKGELSYFHPYKNIADTNGILSASFSFDRSFRKDYFAVVSYLYNSKEKDMLPGINQLTSSALSAKRLMPFEHSFFALVSRSFNPLLNGSMAFIFSPENSTVILLPSLMISVSNNWEAALVGQSFFNDVNGVYRSIGNVIYFRLRWSY